DGFAVRHIGPRFAETQKMLTALGCSTIDELVEQTVPCDILSKERLDLLSAVSEQECLLELRSLADENQVFRNFIGAGYYGTLTPSVIQRNILENPGWYTQYTPYQAEISQGRL